MLTQDISGNCLFVARPSASSGILEQAMRQFAIASESCEDPAVALRLLRSRKYEAVVIDFQFGAIARQLLSELRSSASNRRSVVFALVDHDSEANEAFISGSSFTLAKPVPEDKAVRLLRAAYGMILRERRRYFRCPVSIPAKLYYPDRQPQDVLVVNLSEEGLCIHSSSPISKDEQAFVEFTLPTVEAEISCHTTVCWADSRGRAGLRIESLPGEMKAHLEGWLARRLDELIPPAVTSNLEGPVAQHR
jgi:DNA-binding response OmpR family regulator